MRTDLAPRAGVLALQGGVTEHAALLEALGAHVTLVRRAGDLLGADGPRLDALVLPGGESSTQDRLLSLLDLRGSLREAVAAGLPTLGTCAGLILLARDVLDPAPGQRSLGLLDVAVRRNAFGAQLVSTVAEFEVDAEGVDGIGAAGRHGRKVRAALIRAPEIVEIGAGARAIVNHNGRILGATSASASIPGATSASASIPGAGSDTGSDLAGGLGTVTGISFHPELSGDPAFHRALLNLPS